MIRYMHCFVKGVNWEKKRKDRGESRPYIPFLGLSFIQEKGEGDLFWAPSLLFLPPFCLCLTVARVSKIEGEGDVAPKKPAEIFIRRSEFELRRSSLALSHKAFPTFLFLFLDTFPSMECRLMDSLPRFTMTRDWMNQQ